MEFFKPRSNEINSAVAQHLQNHLLLNNALKTSWILLLKAIHKPTVTSIILTIEKYIFFKLNISHFLLRLGKCLILHIKRQL